MAFYHFGVHSGPFTATESQNLREGLDELRSCRQKLGRAKSVMDQQTTQQIVDSFGVAPVKDADGEITVTAADQAAALKAELASDVAALEANAAALNQLLAQTG